MSATIPDALAVLTPNAQWALTGDTYAGLQWLDETIAKPTEEAVTAEQASLDAQAPFTACTNEASSLLSATDWTSIADVANPAVSNPYLMNQSAFLAYRSQLRQLAVYPVANPVWPTKPTEQWSA